MDQHPSSTVKAPEPTPAEHTIISLKEYQGRLQDEIEAAAVAADRAESEARDLRRRQRMLEQMRDATMKVLADDEAAEIPF